MANRPDAGSSSVTDPIVLRGCQFMCYRRVPAPNSTVPKRRTFAVKTLTVVDDHPNFRSKMECVQVNICFVGLLRETLHSQLRHLGTHLLSLIPTAFLGIDERLRTFAKYVSRTLVFRVVRECTGVAKTSTAPMESKQRGSICICESSAWPRAFGSKGRNPD